MSLIPPQLASGAAKLALGVAASAAGAIKNAISPLEKKTEKTAKDFESMFLENMLAQAFPQESGEGPLGENGVGGQVYRGMMINELGKQVAKSGGIGIADTVYRQMLQMQERANAR